MSVAEVSSNVAQRAVGGKPIKINQNVPQWAVGEKPMIAGKKIHWSKHTFPHRTRYCHLRIVKVNTKKVNQPSAKLLESIKNIDLDRQRFSKIIPSAMLHIKQPSLGETCHKCHCNGAVPASLEVKTPSLKRWKPLKWTMKNGKISLKLKWPFKREKRPLKLKWPFKQEKRPLKVKRHTSYEE